MTKSCPTIKCIATFYFKSKYLVFNTSSVFPNQITRSGINVFSALTTSILLLIGFGSCNSQEKEVYLDCDRNYYPLYDSIFVKIADTGKDTLVELIPKRLKAFQPCRSIRYGLEIKDSTNQTLLTNSLNLFVPGKPWDMDKKQDIIIWSMPDSIRNRSAYQKLNFVEGTDLWTASEITGVIENSRKVFLHPFRSNELEILQYLPFPLIEMPVNINKTYFQSISIYEETAKIMSCNFEYQVDAMSEISLKEEVWPVWQISATSLCGNENGSLKMLFNEELGFVEMNYNYKGFQIKIHMEDINLPTK